LAVVLVVAQLHRGGTERQVALLAGGLSEAGHRVVVATLFDDGAHAAWLRERGIDVRGPLAGPGPLGVLRAVVRLVALLRSVRPDVVHAFLLAGCAVAAPAALLARVPARVAGRRSLGDWKAGRPVAAVLERLTNPGFHAFVANAEAVAQDALRRERLPAARVHVIRNALEPAVFEPVDGPADRPQDQVPSPVVLCVANLIDYKGHRYLLKAHARLREQGLEVGLLLAGAGPEQEALAAQARQAQLAVQLLGARSDVDALLSVVDLVVLPSLHEGMSNALMEAMARGRAVVATDVGGNREVLGDAGVLCPPADPPRLAEAMSRVLRDPQLRADLESKARERAARLFGLDRMVSQHVALYTELARRREVPRCAA
jgi:glycosyltransferase involved in cell wall biosynthesis